MSRFNIHIIFIKQTLIYASIRGFSIGISGIAKALTHGLNWMHKNGYEEERDCQWFLYRFFFFFLISVCCWLERRSYKSLHRLEKAARPSSAPTETIFSWRRAPGPRPWISGRNREHKFFLPHLILDPETFYVSLWPYMPVWNRQSLSTDWNPNIFHLEFSVLAKLPVSQWIRNCVIFY